MKGPNSTRLLSRLSSPVRVWWLARRARGKLRVRTFLCVLLLMIESVTAVLLLCALAIFWNFSSELSNFETTISDNREPVSTKIWSEDGVLLGKLESENRQPILIKDLGGSKVVDATVA